MKKDKAQAVEWLRGLGLSCSRKKYDITARVEKYKKYPSLVKKLLGKVSWQYKFDSSLDTINIPPPSSTRKTDFKLYPSISQKMFYAYAGMKKEGAAGQQEKAVRMLQSLKIVSVKCLIDIETDKRDIFKKNQ